MQGSATETTAEISEEDLAGLPHAALLAFAVRLAWRMLPRQALQKGVAPRESRDTAMVLAGASLVSIGGERDAGVARSLDQTGGLQVTDVVVNAAWDVMANPPTDAPDRHGEVVLALREARVQLIEDLPGAAGDAAWADVTWLRERTSGGTDLNVGVVQEFHQRPLWLRPEGESPPKTWWRIVERWDEGLSKADLPWLVDQHHRLLKGGGLDGALLQRVVEGLFQVAEPTIDTDPDRNVQSQAEPSTDGLADEQAKPARKRRAAKNAGETPADVIPGGIVVATADKPSGEDHLGRTPLVNTLADMLASPEQGLPMTIALLGDWGSGKSSVIEQLKRCLNALAGEAPDPEAPPRTTRDPWHVRLRRNLEDLIRPQREVRNPAFADRCRYLFADFNAWQYEQTSNLRAGLAQEVVRGLTRGLSPAARLRLAVANAASQHGLEFHLTVAGLIALGLLGVLGVLAGDQLSDLNAFTQSLLGTGGAAVLVFGLVRTYQKMVRFLEHPLADRLSTYLRLPDYGKHLGEVPVIKREIRTLCEARLDMIPNGRLLVVVDDLDRCHPDAVIETLDAIRLVMDLKDVAVIVAIDDRIAFRAVAEHYAQLAEDGRSKEEIARDYLGKIIQLPVNLYDPWPEEVGRFIGEYLFVVEAPADAPAPAAQPESPRPPVPAMSPSAARLIADAGVPAGAITGSGQGGRILKKDVDAYLERQAAAPAPPAPATPPPGGPASSGTPRPPETAVTRQEVHERAALMRDSAYERDLFATLAKEMNFHNPRQLIRLHNSYRLLKGYRYSRESRPLDREWVEYLMHGLFWYEFLYQQKLTDRERAELVAWQWADIPEWEQEAQRREQELEQRRREAQAKGQRLTEKLANPPVVNMSRRLTERLSVEEWHEGYPGLMKTVAMAILPNAQMGLILERGKVAARLARQSSGGQVRLDPWRLAVVGVEEPQPRPPA